MLEFTFLNKEFSAFLWGMEIVLAPLVLADEMPGEAQNSKPTQICSLSNCYSIIEKIGTGAFSNVFMVTNAHGEKFALKMYRNTDVDNLPERNIEREFLIGQTLNHPNIIKSIDFFRVSSSENTLSEYLVLPFVEGQTLRSIEQGTLSSQQAIQMVTQLVDALRYAFLLGRFHLDLHFENVLITKKSDIILVDLGSFYNMEETTQYLSRNLETTQSQSLTQCKERDKFPLINPYMSEQEILSYYFNTVTDICNRFIKKSNLERTKKMNLCAEIKKIAWNFNEDIVEGKSVFIEHCFDELLFLLQSS